MSPKRAWNRATVCGVSAISGTSTITPRPRSSVSAAARRYTSVLPEPVTPCSRWAPPARTDSSAAACACVSSTTRSGAGLVRGARRRARGAIVTSPRASSRRSAARSTPAGPGSRSSSARCFAVSRAPSTSPARSAHSCVRARPRGGSTSDSARAGVEQYSSAIHSASSTSSAGTLSARASATRTSFSAGSSLASASPTTTPSSRCRPNGIRTTEPTPTAPSGGR